MWLKLLRAGRHGWYDLAEAQLRILAAAVSVLVRPKGTLVSVESPEPSLLNQLVTSSVPGPDNGGGTGSMVPPTPVPGGALPEDLSRVELAIGRTARFGLLRPRCLIRSMALQRMLAARGFPDAVVRFGVRRRHGVFESHAWVEWQGRVVGDIRSHVRSFSPVNAIQLRTSSWIR